MAKWLRPGLNLFMLIEQTHAGVGVGVGQRPSAVHTKRANNNTIYANDQRHDAAPLL